MITEQDLQAAIAECEGARNPNANTCIKLAAFYIIREHMFEGSNRSISGYSFAQAPDNPTVDKAVDYSGESEFSQAIYGMNENDAWSIMDELMSTLQVVNPKLYDGVMRRIAV